MRILKRRPIYIMTSCISHYKVFGSHPQIQTASLSFKQLSKYSTYKPVTNHNNQQFKGSLCDVRRKEEPSNKAEINSKASYFLSFSQVSSERESEPDSLLWVCFDRWPK
ncbi:hypothetical protein CHUAL_011916 [Chamberlinius hualienensis]